MTAVAPSNYIAEWFGVRLYPQVKCRPSHVEAILANLCPFLTAVLRHRTRCVKPNNALGVCTIATTRAETKDWVVCPYRALDPALLKFVVSVLFSLTDPDVSVYPVVALEDPESLALIRQDLAQGKCVFVFFQDKLGGEISVPGTPRSPELSFDVTLLPIQFDGSTLLLSNFAVYESQTMDFHGSYRHAVTALRNAIDLHRDSFPTVVSQNTEWLGRGIEGPNIANVFKRTFYQLLLKFRLSGRGSCVGVLLSLPLSVWQSWAPHLGAPALLAHGPYQVLAGAPLDPPTHSWICVFQADTATDEPVEPLVARNLINVDPGRLLDAAFRDVPDHIAATLMTHISEAILARVQRSYPDARCV